MIINLAKIRFGGGASAKPEDFFEKSYTANGAYDITPEEGHVFSGGHVEVDVHPTETLSLTITKSGAYTSNEEFNGYSINVDVEGPKPEETLTQTITENGSHVFNPSEGHVFNSASITVDVPDPVLGTLNVTPTTSSQSITAQAEGYEGFSEVNVSAVTSAIDSNITAENIKKDVTILGVTGTLESGVTPTGTINISANGTYDVTDKATAVVAVGGKDYRYKTGTPDVAGLTAIGWTADDIGYYGANTPHYAWENDNYKVSQENIDLYSLDDPQPSLYKNNPNVTFVPNKNMSTYFGTTSGYQAFKDMKYIKSIPLYDTSRMIRVDHMFSGCSSLQTIPLLDTSNVTDSEGMYYMFNGCSSLTSIPQLDTSKVKDMRGMFSGCSSLQTIPPLDTSNVKRINGMFENCSSLQTIPLLDTSKVERMEGMFANCSSLTSIPLLDTSNVISAQFMFSGCSSLQTIPLLDTSNVTHMYQMFNGCSSLQTIPQLNTSSVTNMSYMFKNCSSLTSIPQLNTSNVTSMENMFSNCSGLAFVSFTSTSKVTNMYQMFGSCSSLQSVGGIDFSSLTSKPDYFFGWSTISSLTHFIVNGSINFSWDDSYGLSQAPSLDYESIKSILEAMNRTTNTNAKTMKLNCVIVDREGELAGLVSSCATKGWTVTGLTIKERSMINSITPSSDHIHISDIRDYTPGLTLTIDANEAWTGGGIPYHHTTSGTYMGYQYDFYDANTDKLTRTGLSYYGVTGIWRPDSGSIGTTNITGHYNESNLPAPNSGEYALVGISIRTESAPYEFVDYYFKVYPDGE